MTDPVLHEPTIMDTLDCNPYPENTSRLQAAALLCLIDAFDRKLTRESFITLASAALAMHTQAGKLFMIASIGENDKIGTLDTPMIDKAVRGVQGLATTAHAELYGLMNKVVQCPTSADRIN